jgi:anti-sigma factor RsiW
MAHVDDGTLNALLDGELDGAEAAEVRAHLAGCTECAARFQDAQRFLDEAAELLGVLAPAAPEARPADVRPAEPPASPQPGPAGVAPLVPVAPAGSAASGEPPRRISKTAREIAVDLDGGTHKSPAIAPNFPRAGEPLPAPEPYFSRREVLPLNRPAYRRPDWATLAWAASVVLALGVGYLANEVKRGRATLASGDEAAVSAVDSVPAQATRRVAATRAASPPAAAKALGSLAVRGTLGPRPTAARGPKPPRQAAADAVTLAAVPAEAAGITTNAPAAELAAARAAPSPAAAAPGAGGVLGARAQPQAAAPTFRSTNVDEAEAHLAGTLRTVEGLALENVKIGPGSLVPGAVPTQDVVRLVYTEPSGRRLQLDQQRLPQARDTSREARARAVPPTLGLGYGDTLVTAGPAGEARVRWLDQSGLWLSLLGNMPADSLRALLARIR